MCEYQYDEFQTAHRRLSEKELSQPSTRVLGTAVIQTGWSYLYPFKEKTICSGVRAGKPKRLTAYSIWNWRESQVITLWRGWEFCLIKLCSGQNAFSDL